MGPKLDLEEISLLKTGEIKVENDNTIRGTIDILDVRFGNLWTNIPKEDFENLGIKYGDTVELTINHDSRKVYSSTVKYVKSFSEVNTGATLLYVNSLHKIGVAINQGSFSKAHQVDSGYQWKVEFKK